MMKAKVITLGCKVNQYESEAMLSSLCSTALPQRRTRKRRTS